ncbi:hypothetical protein H6P81_013667 [Aristolochia fimbriata]|uniref:Reverse transcriptase domain-containing protein n=1 Tax=Aristolochia fimbriata TaxID=158543 RepID=A0AAV7EFT7_ARIFI|nr:hypothetical protein H6P81_013667 [Aristolochia fimbriata]
MKEVGISAGDLSASLLLIKGFNLESQRTLGMIQLDLQIGEMVANTPLQVIDSMTTYNLLLGRPWLHANGVVPSTLHQCFNYWKDDEQKMVYANRSPFTEAEASFANAKFYLTTRPTVRATSWPNQAQNIKAETQPKQTPKELLKTMQPKPPIHGRQATTTNAPALPPMNNTPMLRSEGDRLPPRWHGLGYQKGKPIRITGRSADVHQVTVDQSSARENRALVVIYTKVAFAQARTPADKLVAVNHISITGEDEQGDDEFILKDAPAAFEEGGQSTVDELKKINLGSEEDPRPTILSASLAKEEEVEYISQLQEYRDVFAWNYTEMPGLDSKVAVHKLAVHPVVRPVKQTQRRFLSELVPEIEKEVDKLIAANFIREVKYPSWIANIMSVKKKSGQIRVCVSFCDLNKACPKDDFPLPITELMVDATTGHEALSFMDGSSGYNQIRMDPKDEELTAFRTPKVIFYYKGMSFGLKNAGATYQRAMQHIFDDFLHKRVECYVDDLVVKTKDRADHLLNLRVVFM